MKLPPGGASPLGSLLPVEKSEFERVMALTLSGVWNWIARKT